MGAPNKKAFSFGGIGGNKKPVIVKEKTTKTEPKAKKKPSFSFGLPKTSEPKTAEKENKPAFSFGGGKSTANKPIAKDSNNSKPAFSFGVGGGLNKKNGATASATKTEKRPVVIEMKPMMTTMNAKTTPAAAKKIAVVQKKSVVKLASEVKSNGTFVVKMLPDQGEVPQYFKK